MSYAVQKHIEPNATVGTFRSFDLYKFKGEPAMGTRKATAAVPRTKAKSPRLLLFRWMDT